MTNKRYATFWLGVYAFISMVFLPMEVALAWMGCVAVHPAFGIVIFGSALTVNAVATCVAMYNYTHRKKDGNDGDPDGC